MILKNIVQYHIELSNINFVTNCYLESITINEILNHVIFHVFPHVSDILISSLYNNLQWSMICNIKSILVHDMRKIIP